MSQDDSVNAPEELEPLPAWPADDEEVAAAEYSPTVAYDEGALEPAVETLPEEERIEVLRSLVEATSTPRTPVVDEERAASVLDASDDSPVAGWEPEPEPAPSKKRAKKEKQSSQDDEDSVTLIAPSSEPVAESVAEPDEAEAAAPALSTDDLDVLAGVPGTVLWEIRGMLNDEGEFLSKMELLRKPPSLVISSDEVTAEIILTPRVTERMGEAFGALGALYDESQSILGDKRKKKARRTFSELLSDGIDWWFAHKVRGTFLVLIFGAIAYAIISGFWVMLTKG